MRLVAKGAAEAVTPLRVCPPRRSSQGQLSLEYLQRRAAHHQGGAAVAMRGAGSRAWEREHSCGGRWPWV